MNKTIKQIADELGVSKTAVRNYMTADFRAKYTAKDSKGVITITQEGCEVIAEMLGKTENEHKESSETELITIPRSVLTLLENQLKEKDVQLAEKDRQIMKLETLLDQAQQLHVRSLPEQKQLSDSSGKKSFFGWLRKKGE